MGSVCNFFVFVFVSFFFFFLDGKSVMSYSVML